MESSFGNVRDTIVFNNKIYDGFGTYGEKSIHAVIKRYIEPDTDYHEVGISGSIADICRDGMIYEIQTHSLFKLKTKLEKFLKTHRVCVVYPVVAKKTLYTIDSQTGSIIRKRTSPQKGSVYDFLPQIYGLRELLSHPSLSFRIMVITASEYRTDVKSSSHRRGEKLDTVPEELICEVRLNGTNDFIKLVPPSLPDEFGSLEFSKAASVSRSDASTSLNILAKCNIIKKINKKGNAFIYRII